MLRIILCVFIPLFFNYNNLSSQILKLSGGINRTWMNEKPFDAPCLTYTGSLGYDYLLDRDYYDWFYLSSEIGYIKRSGKNAITGSKLNMDHLHLNTLFKVKYSFENLMMSAGVGPSVDYRVIKGGQSNKLVFGARPEIGLSYFLSNRISLYFTVAYLKGFSGIIRKTKCFDFWERNVLFPKTKRSFFRTPKHPLPCPFPLNFSLLIITKKFGNLAKNRYICIV